MLEAAQLLGWFSGALLIVAVAAWVKLFQGPGLQRLDNCVPAKVGNVEIASQLLVLTAGLSGVAAIVAVVGWIFT